MPDAVTKLVRPDGTAQYRLTKDVTTEKDPEDNDILVGNEVYFEITPDEEQPTAAEVEADFDSYWASGFLWPIAERPEKSIEQRLADCEADNVTALEGIAELYEMIMQ